ncbi:MAG TPA: DEAD/DEAH box helicase [Bacteroides sp.]|nr:DEAD/DEAH box helicase [Bacteroides sp.]
MSNNSSYKYKHRSKSASTTNKSNRSFNNNRRPSRQGYKPSTLDPSLLVKEAIQTEENIYKSDRFINDLPISNNLKQCLDKKGYKRPTEIQDKTIENLIEGKDLLGIAQTGTGKTGAFLIPIIEQLLHKKVNPYALIVVPTRELATQVEEEFRSMTKGLGLYSSCFIGGTNISRDMQNLRRPSHVVIATPGRLLDLVNRRALSLNRFNTLVLDEFDRMLDMGFIRDVQKIIDGMYHRNQTMLFSATLDKSQQSLINSILRDPVTVKVSSGDRPVDSIDQDIIRLKPGEDKFDILYNMLCEQEFSKVLLFEETKHKVKRLCQKLNKVGIKAEQIHGDKSQNARQHALNDFKNGRVRVLVATDVASRGIDVSDVSHVINYQVPQTHDSYIHRIGRTGRAGKIGKALTFVA